MPPTGPYASELQIVGVGKETAFGTAVAPDYFLSAKSPKPEDVIANIKDDGVRGVNAAVFGVYAGVQHATFDTDFEVFPDAIGRLLGAIVGADAVTGAGPYVHTFSLGADQPDSLTVSHFDGYETRQYPGSRLTELSLKWSEGADVTGSIKTVSKPSAVGTALTPSFPTSFGAFQGWQASMTLAGTADLNLVGYELDLKRKEYIQHAANGSQAPSNIIVKGLEVSGKMTFDLNDDTELTAFLNNTQPVVVVTLTLSANETLVITTSKTAFMKAPISSKDVVQIDVDFEGVYNATDGGPCKIVLTNQVATAY